MGRQGRGFRWDRGLKKVHFSLPGAKRTGQDSTFPEPQLWQVAHLLTFSSYIWKRKKKSLVRLSFSPNDFSWFFLKLSKRFLHFLLRIKVFKLRTRQSKSKNLFQILESFFYILTVFMSLYGRRCRAFNFNRLHWLQSFLDFGSIFDHSELSSFTFLTFGTILSFFSPTPPPCTVCPLCPFLPHPSFCSATDRSWVTGAFWVIF